MSNRFHCTRRVASKQAVKRLGVEYKNMQTSPPPFCWAKPNESNVLEWHYIFRGPPDTPHFGGEFWGTVVFPADYPFAPPALKMNTPSGRFAPSQAICTSMSNFHPGSWNPAWSINTILVGLLSFMLGDEITTGSIRTSDAEKKAFAEASHAWNIAQPKFRTMFPEYSLPTMKDLPLMSGQAPPPPTTSAAIGAQTPVPPSSSDTRTEPNGVVLPSSETTIDDLRIAGGEGGERQGVLRRWRRELVWTLVVLLVSWACASLLAEA